MSDTRQRQPRPRIRWHLRQVMAARGLFATTELLPLLADRGVHLSREQVYRLVTGTPQRLNLEVLAALCDALGCGPQDLLEVVAEPRQARKVAGEATGRGVGELRPVPARIRQPGQAPDRGRPEHG